MNNNQTPSAFILLTDRTDGRTEPPYPFCNSNTTTYIHNFVQLCVFIFFYIQLGQECFSALSDNAPIGQHFLAVRNAMRFFNYILYRVRTEKNSTRVIRRYCSNYLIIYCHHNTRFFL